MVIYFSGTGNSRYAAESIAKLTGDELVCANDYIKAAKAANFSSEKPYVFVAPTYAYRIPRVFKEFIELSSFSGSKSAYFVMTCGSGIGNPDKYNKELSDKTNLYYMGVKMLKMPENYIAIFEAPSKAESELLIQQADKSLKALSDIILSGSESPKEKIGVLGSFLSGPINTFFYKHIISAKGFNVTDKCISCGKCEKLCPVKNIKLCDGKPVYSDQCTHCMACICACPTEAIEYKKHTVGKSRYYLTRSPEINSNN
ncbi:MAG: EFR1 family ferrodoxin [Oscillospiraceae bacterium]|nr:EFR1 family ferrodoxin [Oscillospiraceae bacterium]